MHKKAEDYFHCKDGNYNCAQSILKAFQKKFNISDEMIKEYKKYGGGKADDNTCGALFAALKLAEKNLEKKEMIAEEFAKIAGSTKCKQISGLKKLSCRECVKVAGELLEKSTEQ